LGTTVRPMHDLLVMVRVHDCPLHSWKLRNLYSSTPAAACRSVDRGRIHPNNGYRMANLGLKVHAKTVLPRARSTAFISSLGEHR